MLIPDNNKRIYSCFVCAKLFNSYDLFCSHVIEAHEESREYLICPLKHCRCPVRDLRCHFKAKHPHNKIPDDVQLRATVMHDTKNPKKKVPSFKEGYVVSDKNNGRKMHYRSGFEKDVYDCLERIGDVLAYEVEPFSVWYFHKGKRRQYFPDLKVIYSDGSVEIWEVKPKNQVFSEQNQAKFTACKAFCKLRGWNFETIVEHDIENLKKRVGK